MKEKTVENQHVVSLIFYGCSMLILEIVIYEEAIFGIKRFVKSSGLSFEASLMLFLSLCVCLCEVSVSSYN